MIYFLEKHCSKKKIIIGVIYIAFINLIAFPFFPKLFEATYTHTGILDLHFGFDTNEVLNILRTLGTAGRQIYFLSTLLIDFPYALIYGFIYSFILIFLLKKTQIYKRVRYFVFLPFFISFFDIIENSFIIYFINAFPNINSLAVVIASFSNQLKWIFAALTALSVLSVLLKIIYQKLKKN